MTAADADGLTIAADGLRSTHRAALNGQQVPFFTGQTAWRALIPDPGGAPVAQVFMAARRHLVSYPLPGGLRNIVAVEERPDWQDEGLVPLPRPRPRMRTAFASMGGPVPN